MCPSSAKPDILIFAAVEGALLSWIVSNRQSSVTLDAIMCVLFPFTADPRQFLGTKILSFCVNERRVNVTSEMRQLYTLLEANHVTRDRKHAAASIRKSGFYLMRESGICCHPTVCSFWIYPCQWLHQGLFQAPAHVYKRKAGTRHVSAPGRLIIWHPGQANNLAPLQTDILSSFSA
jgi:hypothetical protein